MTYVIMNNIIGLHQMYTLARDLLNVGKITARSLNPRFYYNVPDPDQD